MRECPKCGNYIPKGLYICPHCAGITSIWQGNMLRLVGGIMLLLLAMAALSLCFAPSMREATSFPMMMIVFVVFPLVGGGVFLIKRAMKDVWEQHRIVFYKKHTMHTVAPDSCHCNACGKLVKQHDWEGCRCKTCGKTRDEGHNWDGCRCTICHKTRNAEHDWNGCKCKKCGKWRNEEHDWDGVTCSICGLKCGENEHSLDSHCRCKICGKAFHEYETSKGEVTLYSASDNTQYGEVTVYTCKKCGHSYDDSKERYW